MVSSLSVRDLGEGSGTWEGDFFTDFYCSSCSCGVNQSFGVKVMHCAAGC